MLLQLAKPLLTDFLKIVHRSIFLKFVLNSIFSDIHNQIFFIFPNIDPQCFIIKNNPACQDFPYWRIVIPTLAKKFNYFPHH